MHSKLNDIALARRISSRLKPSRKWEPMQPSEPMRSVSPAGVPELVHVWSNRWYTVSHRLYEAGWMLGGGIWIQLGIYCEDGEPRHDWRDFQRIKNDICGPEWEAVELYPAESRLVDPSNYYTLYCAPSVPLGIFKGRTIANAENCLAPQRPWARGDEPK